MQELITIREQMIGSEAAQTVDARELHAFLASKQSFATWIKARIDQYDFAEGVDFAIFNGTVDKSARGRPTKDYAITLDMAKQLSMVERNEQGKKARLYFIECERRAKIAQQAIPDFERLVEQTEQTRALITASGQQVAEIGRVIGGVTRNVVKEFDAKHAVTIRALGKLVNEYLVKRVILPLDKMAGEVGRLSKRVDQVLSMAERATRRDVIVLGEWLDVSRIYERAGAHPPRKGILSQQISRSLDAWCKDTDNQHVMKRMHGHSIWHFAAVDGWLAAKGKSLITDHCNRHAAPSRDAA